MTPTELSTRAEPPRSTPPGAEPLSRGDEASGGEGGEGVRVRLTVAPTLNFALEQSGVPLVPMVRIFNDRAAPLHGVRLEVELLPDLGPRHVFAIPPLHGGETAELGPLDLLAVGVRIRSLQSAGTTRGPLAFVVPDDKYWLVAGVLGILAIPKRPMRVFKEAQKARAWLDSPAVIAKTPG